MQLAKRKTNQRKTMIAIGVVAVSVWVCVVVCGWCVCVGWVYISHIPPPKVCGFLQGVTGAGPAAQCLCGVMQLRFWTSALRKRQNPTLYIWYLYMYIWFIYLAGLRPIQMQSAHMPIIVIIIIINSMTIIIIITIIIKSKAEQSYAYVCVLSVSVFVFVIVFVFVLVCRDKTEKS